ncbi:hypothetical protein [Agrobacterium rubi]|uniref:Uncharacterized protein n=1 Tax=Agrobacterium rubi TaxID=28099 RepID=A0AAE7R4A9_9HYPH|nr:hypothetical protein [Agrobacterium rubi]NTE87833.1 hypothetical protein [Agrobacterium rubi]NTF05169.1 hypothetical protein [Agrobacterium rubi]NTF37926.1 hypothetical protein [Agrobacterium rubi]OCJ54177.1 hypothetical protein A6U92_22900 [Agrobacterium rubi]QTG01788.1 hypothetical protein G6M88_14985 [Agrobacterium rubi]
MVFWHHPELNNGAIQDAHCLKGWEAGVMAAVAGSVARAISLLVQYVSDLTIDVITEELVDLFNDAGLRLDLLGGGGAPASRSQSVSPLIEEL